MLFGLQTSYQRADDCTLPLPFNGVSRYQRFVIAKIAVRQPKHEAIPESVVQFAGTGLRDTVAGAGASVAV